MKIYTVKDLQSVLKIGRDAAYSLMKSAGFPSYQINDRYFVTEESLDKWLNSIEGKKFNL